MAFGLILFLTRAGVISRGALAFLESIMEYVIKSNADLINQALKVMETQAASKRGKELFTSPQAVKRYFRFA